MKKLICKIFWHRYWEYELKWYWIDRKCKICWFIDKFETESIQRVWEHISIKPCWRCVEDINKDDYLMALTILWMTVICKSRWDDIKDYKEIIEQEVKREYKRTLWWLVLWWEYFVSDTKNRVDEDKRLTDINWAVKEWHPNVKIVKEDS